MREAGNGLWDGGYWHWSKVKSLDDDPVSSARQAERPTLFRVAGATFERTMASWRGMGAGRKMHR